MLKNKDDEIKFLRNTLQKDLEKENEYSEYFGKVTAEKTLSNIINNYKNLPKEEVLENNFSMSQNHITTLALGLAPEMHDEKIQKLINIFLTEGVHNVFSILKQMNDPHLEDDFHRFLVQYILKEGEQKKMGQYKDTLKSIETTLFEVILQSEFDDKKMDDAKNICALMERFYAGMMSFY
jgi:hypothetical protein